MGSSASDIVDAIIVNDPNPNGVKPASRTGRARGKRPETTDDDSPREPKAGPPNLDEWTKFFSNIVLRVSTQWYLNFAFRGIDEDALSEREIERLAMTPEERKTIAVPFAELSNKSKFMRRHGRTLVASGDAFNAMVVMGAWMSRVNRIASKHKVPKVSVRLNGNSGTGNAGGDQNQGTGDSRIPDGFRVYPGSG